MPFNVRSATVLIALSLFVLPLLEAASPVGLWRTIDDRTGETKSLVEIYQTASGTLEGRVEEVLQSDQGPNPICHECPGERKGQPIEGMVILWGMESDGEVWQGGKILDPKNGKIYRCKLQLAGPDRLEVRGFIGISLLGRTQTWERVEAES